MTLSVNRKRPSYGSSTFYAGTWGWIETRITCYFYHFNSIRLFHSRIHSLILFIVRWIMLTRLSKWARKQSMYMMKSMGYSFIYTSLCLLINSFWVLKFVSFSFFFSKLSVSIRFEYSDLSKQMYLKNN